MSRSYNMNVAVYHAKPMPPDFEERLKKEWPFDSVTSAPLFVHDENGDSTGGMIIARGDGTLGEGQPVKEFVDQICEAVWELNGEYCEVVVNATYLEDLPCESYSSDEEQYQRLMGCKEVIVSEDTEDPELS